MLELFKSMAAAEGWSDATLVVLLTDILDDIAAQGPPFDEFGIRTLIDCHRPDAG